MIRILMFGDSQVATIATAFNQSSSAQSVMRLEFICAHGPVARRLRTSAHRLHLDPPPATWAHARISDERLTKWHGDTQAQITALCDGEPAIDLTQFDALVCTGGHVLARWNMLHDVATTQYLSAACIEQVALDMTNATQHGQWLSGLADSPHRGSVAVLSLPEPLLNEASPLIETSDYAAKDFTRVQEVIAKALARLGSTYIPVPEDLISASGNGSPAQYKVDRVDDYVHLNREGGEIMLQSLVGAFDGLVAQSLQSRVID